MSPFYSFDLFSYATAMALGTVIGFFFGLVLEGAGFGRSQNLVAQFYGEDMRVFKVMFSAIVTAMLGLGLLGGLGLVDLTMLQVPATWLWPQIVGGLLLGVGFAMSGYCPGTAVVSVSTGYVDGLVTLVGIGIGSLAFGFVYPSLEAFYLSGDLGVLQLTDLTGLPWPVLALGVMVIAMGCFLGAEAFERWFAARKGAEPPPASPPLRNLSFGTMAAGAALGLATLALPAASDADAPREIAALTPSELASRIVEDPSAVYIVDLRDRAVCEESRVPGALCLPEDDPDASFVSDFPPTRALVLYAAGDLGELPVAARAYRGAVFTVAGGFDGFEAEVLTAPVPPDNPTPEAVASYQLKSEIHRHFTGTAVRAAPIRARPKKVVRKIKKGGGC